MPQDPRVDAYIASRNDFAKPVLAHLRALIHTRVPGVDEAIKWSMPAFVYKGRLLANMAAFREHASFSFWNRADTATGREGEAMGQLGRLTALADLPHDTDIVALINAAVAAIDDDTKPRRAARPPRPEATVPAALAIALADDAKAAATWAAFPPSCRREYCEWIDDAKRDETRARRVAQTIAQLREGKRHNWRYMAG